MSSKINLSFDGLATILAGFILFVTGILLTLNTWSTEFIDVKPWFLMPVGLILALLGLMLMVARGE